MDGFKRKDYFIRQNVNINNYMKYKIPFFIFCLTLFVGLNLVTYCGFTLNVFQAFLLTLSIPCMLSRKNEIVRNKPLLFLLIFIIVYSVFKLFTDTGEGTRMAVMQILGAPIIISIYPILSYERKTIKNQLYWNKLLILFIIFYLIETGMAILERIIGYNILGWRDVLFTFSNNTIVSFRSTALHGHPLYNALIVSTCMSFILISSIKTKYRYVLWFLGYMSILCFNTRSSIVGNALLLLIHTVYTVFFNFSVSSREKQNIFIMFIFLLVCGFLLIFNWGFGGRLLDLGLFDDSSSQTRIDALNIFDFIGIEDILFGCSHSEFEYMKYSAGLLATENFWIDQIFRFGLIFMIVYIIIYCYLIKKLYNGYSNFDKLFTSCSFLLIASTNNSLSSSFIALLIWLLLICIFNPLYLNDKDCETCKYL